MVGCKLIVPSGELDHACKRSFPTVLGALAHFTGLGRRDGAGRALSQYRATELGDDEAGEVDAVNGAFMLVRREAVARGRTPRRGLLVVHGGSRLVLPLLAEGWRVFYEPGGTAIHVKGGSSEARRRIRQEVAFHRGMGRFYRKFYAPGRPTVENPPSICGIGLKLAISLAITIIRGAIPPRS